MFIANEGLGGPTGQQMEPEGESTMSSATMLRSELDPFSDQFLTDRELPNLGPVVFFTAPIGRREAYGGKSR